MLNAATYDISFSFEQPDHVLRALLNPIQQRLNLAPAASHPREFMVRNGLTILIIDTYENRAQYIANLLITRGYRPVVTTNALVAFTLFLQGSCLPLAIVLGQEDVADHLFLLRLVQQLAQKYGWQAPLLRLLVSSPSQPSGAPSSAERQEPTPSPARSYQPTDSSPSLSPTPIETVTPPPIPRSALAPAALPGHTRLARRDKNSSASFPPLVPILSGPLPSIPDQHSEPLTPLDQPESSVPQLDFSSSHALSLPESMLSVLPQLEVATQIPVLPAPTPAAPEPLSEEPAEPLVEQDAGEMLARIKAYRNARLSLEGQTVIIRYQVRKLLGGGAYSDVYLTHDRFREQECALKAIQTDLLPARLSSSLEDVTIFQREIELLNRIKHPHILPVLNSGKSYINSAPFIYKSMPYCVEGSLVAWMQRRGEKGSYALDDLMPLFHQLADALQYAHNARILYQNFKQSNVLVVRSGKRLHMLHVALADFSTMQDTPLAPLSPESLLYIAPERWQGSVQPASDQYGFAALVYELLAGRPPYQGGAERTLKLLHTTRQPQRASVLNRRLSPHVDEVLLRALAKMPEDRFESVAHFVQELERCL